MAFGLIPWRMVAVVFPTTATIMGDSLLYVVLPVSAAEFGIDKTFGLSAAFWVGVALSINRFIRLLSNSWAAAVYRRFGLRAPFISSVVLGGVTTLAYSFSSGIWLLLLARALWGVSYSFLRLASYITALDPGSAGMRGRLIGFFNAGQRLGSLIAVTLGAYLIVMTDRSTGFAIVAAAGLAGVLCSLWTAPLVVQQARPVKGAGAELAPPDQRPGPSLPISERLWNLALSSLPASRTALRRQLLSIALLRSGLAFATNGLIIATVSPYLQSVGESDRAVFGLAIAVVTLAGLLVGSRWFADLALSLPLGHLSDRIGRRATVAGAMVICVAATSMLALSQNFETAVIALPVLFFASVGAQTALEAQFGETVPDDARAPAMGRFSTWLDLGAALGALAGLPLADAAGFGPLYFGSAAVLLLLWIVYARSTRNAGA